MNKNFVMLAPESTITNDFNRGLILNGRAYLDEKLYFYKEVEVKEKDVRIQFEKINILEYEATAIYLHKDLVEQYATSYEYIDPQNTIGKHKRKKNKAIQKCKKKYSKVKR